MQVKIQKSKMDQYRDGASLLVYSRHKFTYLPSSNNRVLLCDGQMSSAHVFRDIVSTKSRSALENPEKLAVQAWELMLSKIASLGYDASKFSMHSFHAGGSTVSVNAGINDRLFKRQGR